MTTYTDAEVDAVALAIRAEWNTNKLAHIGESPNADLWRRAARAALAARDALFETVAERWEARDGEGYNYPYETRDVAAEERDELLAHGLENASLVHVVTKRRKR